MGEYADYPADYAEVSSFKRTPSEYSGTRSPAPYATTTLIGSSKLNTSDMNKLNMFYTSEMYPPQNGGPTINNNQNNTYSRNVYSESYYNPNEKSSTENRMINTMNYYNQNGATVGRRNRLKSMRPPNFRINFGNNQHEQQQLYIKIGETNPPHLSKQHIPHIPQSTPSNQGSMNWNPNSFNIYENHLHDHSPSRSTAGDSHQDVESVKSEVYGPAGNTRNLITYISAKDFSDNV